MCDRLGLAQTIIHPTLTDTLHTPSSTMASELTNQLSQAAVLVESEPMPEDAVTIEGHKFGPPGSPVDYDALLGSYLRTGFQATNFGLAVEQINKMVRQWPFSVHATPPQLSM